MCGIFAYSGYKNSGKILLEGLTILQNRGYDSVGLTTINSEKKYITSKFASEDQTGDAIFQLTKTIFKHDGCKNDYFFTFYSPKNGNMENNRRIFKI